MLLKCTQGRLSILLLLLPTWACEVEGYGMLALARLPHQA